jgi:hypothetical protein
LSCCDTDSAVSRLPLLRLLLLLVICIRFLLPSLTLVLSAVLLRCAGALLRSPCSAARCCCCDAMQALLPPLAASHSAFDDAAACCPLPFPACVGEQQHQHQHHEQQLQLLLLQLQPTLLPLPAVQPPLPALYGDAATPCRASSYWQQQQPQRLSVSLSVPQPLPLLLPFPLPPLPTLLPACRSSPVLLPLSAREQAAAAARASRQKDWGSSGQVATHTTTAQAAPAVSALSLSLCLLSAAGS